MSRILRATIGLILFSCHAASSWAITTGPTISDEQLFSWGAAVYPNYFSGVPVAGQYLQYDYRYFPGSGVYLGVSNTGEVVVLGGVFGDNIVTVGSTTDFAPAVAAWEKTITYTVGGSVSGLASGSQITIQNNSNDTLTVGSNGTFTFHMPIAYGGNFTVVVSNQPVGQTCSIANNSGSGAGVTANIYSVNVICSTSTYTLGGTVSGLANGSQISLDENSTLPLIINSNGNFTFPTPIAYGGSYSVTVNAQPNGQTCTISNGSGNNVAGNISTVVVSCASLCTTLSGVLSANVVYTASNSPYCINGSLQIPAGLSATFDAGTSINNGTIVVQGTLNINGNTSNFVNMANVSVVPAGLSATPHSININGAVVNGGNIYGPTGNAIYGSLNLSNSRLTNLGSYMYVWYPIGTNTISGNSFNGSGGISCGVDFRNSKFVSLLITNNYFSNWTSGYAIENWAQYGTGTVLIQGNTFATTSSVAVRLPGGYTDAAMNAANNYWGTTNTSTIQSMIFDKNVDITSAGYINYLPILTAPANGTPTQ